MQDAPFIPKTPADVPAVEINGLWTAFGQGARQVVIHQDLDWRVEPGEVVSIVGGSGSGKTTLLRQILGLERPYKGSIRVFGEGVDSLTGHDASSRIGMLFQRGALFSAFSVLDNVALPLRELRTLPDDVIRDIALVKLSMVGLSVKDADKSPAQLSGGMIKRVALARALVMDPPLLLLDEPTAGLDPQASDAFCALLKSLHQELDLTVLMITHDLDTVFDLSTQVAVLADKKIIAYAPPAQVAQVDHPFIREYFLGDRGRRAMQALPAH